MTHRSHATGRGTRRFAPWAVAPVLAPVLAAALVAVVGAAFVGGSEAGAQQRRVVVVGDSIVLGAQSALVGGFQGAGWQITFDAQVSRSTVAAVDAVEAHRAELTDSLVLSFGANDAGNPATFRARVERVLAATASVPNVYWLTIREVRDYYPAANQVLRDVAAAHPNVTVVDWHGATAGADGLTAGDGLHLTGAGANRMAELLLGAVVHGVAPPPAQLPVVLPAPPTTAPPPPPLPPPETTVAPTTVAPTTAAPATTVVETTTTAATSSTTTTEADSSDAERAAEPDDLAAASTIDLGDAAGWTAAVGSVLVLAVLLGGGLGLGVWSLASTRGKRRDGGAAPPAPDQPDAVQPDAVQPAEPALDKTQQS